MKNVLIILILLLTSLSISKCKLNKENYLFEIQNATKKNDTISFEKIIKKDWDSLVIIYPYTNLKQLSLTHKIDLSSVSENIEFSDNINTLVFLKNNNVVDYSEILRAKCEFNCRKVIIPKSKSIFVSKKNVHNAKRLYLECLN